MVGIVIGRRAAAGAGFASAMLGVAVFAPRTGRIAMITVIRGAVSTGAAGCRSAMLTGRRIAPRAIAHAVRSVVIAGCAAVSTIAFPAMLAAGVFFPRAVAVTMAARIDGFTFGLTAGTGVRPVAVAGTGSRLLALRHPCMTAAIRASAGTVGTGAVALCRITA